jgi:hypothetical protein
MKKIRVKYLAGITLAFMALSFLITIIYTVSVTRKLPWSISALMLFVILMVLSSLFGFVTNNDFNRKFGGDLIDENQYLRWSNLLETRWMVTFTLQIIFIIFNPLIMKIIGVPIFEGWSEGIGSVSNDDNVPLLFKFFLTFSPSLIFIFGGLIWKINKSDEELIKLKRRDRVRTEDLEELHKKVDLQKWIKNDPALQIDKELFSKLVHIDYWLINNFDDSLKRNKDFILGLPSINYSILDWASHFHIEFKEIDFSDELIYKIFKNSDELVQTRGSSEFAKIYTKKIIEIYSNIYNNQNGFTPASLMNLYYSFKNILKIHNAEIHRYPTLELYKVCLNDKHIIVKELEHCPYCK